MDVRLRVFLEGFRELGSGLAVIALVAAFGLSLAAVNASAAITEIYPGDSFELAAEGQDPGQGNSQWLTDISDQRAGDRFRAICSSPSSIAAVAIACWSSRSIPASHSSV